MKNIHAIKFLALASAFATSISLFSAGIQEVGNEQQLKQIIANNDKVVVDFWSQTCPPCKRLLPNIQSVATKRNDVTIVKINVSNSYALSQKYSVTALPTLIFFKNGKEVSRRTGYMSESELNSAINSILK